MDYSTLMGFVLILYGTVGCRLRLFTLIPCGDPILLHAQDFWVKISNSGEGINPKSCLTRCSYSIP